MIRPITGRHLVDDDAADLGARRRLRSVLRECSWRYCRRRGGVSDARRSGRGRDPRTGIAVPCPRRPRDRTRRRRRRSSPSRSGSHRDATHVVPGLPAARRHRLGERRGGAGRIGGAADAADAGAAAGWPTSPPWSCAGTAARTSASADWCAPTPARWRWRWPTRRCGTATPAVRLVVRYEHDQTSPVLRTIAAFAGRDLEQTYDDAVTCTFTLPAARRQRFREALRDATHGALGRRRRRDDGDLHVSELAPIARAALGLSAARSCCCGRRAAPSTGRPPASSGSTAAARDLVELAYDLAAAGAPIAAPVEGPVERRRAGSCRCGRRRPADGSSDPAAMGRALAEFHRVGAAFLDRAPALGSARLADGARHRRRRLAARRAARRRAAGAAGPAAHRRARRQLPGRCRPGGAGRPGADRGRPGAVRPRRARGDRAPLPRRPRRASAPSRRPSAPTRTTRACHR